MTKWWRGDCKEDEKHKRDLLRREGGRKGGMVEEKRKKSRDYKVGTKSVRNRFKSREKSERWSE